jgi:hypothetical protein
MSSKNTKYKLLFSRIIFELSHYIHSEYEIKLYNRLKLYIKLNSHENKPSTFQRRLQRLNFRPS